MSTFFIFWAIAFVSLVAAVSLLGLYNRIVGTALDLNSVSKELILAFMTSAVQAGGYRLLLPFFRGLTLPVGSRWVELAIPAVVLLFTYKLGHVAAWDQHEVLWLLVFQLVIAFVGVSLLRGDLQQAFIVLGAFMAALLFVGGIVRQT